jgi:hypothetical protein
MSKLEVIKSFLFLKQRDAQRQLKYEETINFRDCGRNKENWLRTAS